MLLCHLVLTSHCLRKVQSSIPDKNYRNILPSLLKNPSRDPSALDLKHSAKSPFKQLALILARYGSVSGPVPNPNKSNRSFPCRSRPSAVPVPLSVWFPKKPEVPRSSADAVQSATRHTNTTPFIALDSLSTWFKILLVVALQISTPRVNKTRFKL